MIIDVRCRLTAREAVSYFAGRAAKRGKLDLFPAIKDGTVEGFFREIGDAGITTAVSVSGNNPGLKIGTKENAPRTTPNDLMAEVQRNHWGKFIGVAGIDASNAFHNALKEIERCHQFGLRVVFIEPGRAPMCNLDDRRLYSIYEKCVELDMALIPQTSGLWGGKSIDYANPKHLEVVAEDFPQLRIVAGHACYPYVREAIIVAARHENVFLSPDFYLLQMGTEDWVKSVNSNFFGFQDQFLFGSGYPISMSIKQYVEEFFKLPWKEEVLPKILYKNALRAFKLEDDPTFRQIYKL